MGTSKNKFISPGVVSNFIKPRHIIGLKYYLYIHTRDDKDGELFYIGIGTSYYSNDYNRSLSRRGRNKIWKGIVNKSPYKVFIVDESDDKDLILRREKQYIALMGKRISKTGSLANMTDGGEGRWGLKTKHSAETRRKMSEARKGIYVSPETREKLRKLIYTRGLTHRKGKENPLAKAVQKFDLVTGQLLMEFETIADAARSINVTSQSLSHACNKGFKTKGFKWRFKNG